MFKCFSACGLPEIFALKDYEGIYPCMHETGPEIRFDPNCPNENRPDAPVSYRKHHFLAYSKESWVDSNSESIPDDKCVIANYYWWGHYKFFRPHPDGNIKMESGGYKQGTEYHFQAIDTGNGKIKILSSKDNKLVEKKPHNDHFHLYATGDQNTCGETCIFTLEDHSDYAPPGLFKLNLLLFTVQGIFILN